MRQKGIGALGSIIDLFAAEAASGISIFFLTYRNWNTYSFPITSHFDSNFNQDQLRLHPTPASSWATVRSSLPQTLSFPHSENKC